MGFRVIESKDVKFEELVRSVDELPLDVVLALTNNTFGAEGKSAIPMGQKEFVSFLKTYIFGNTKGFLVKDSFIYDYVDYLTAYQVVLSTVLKKFVQFEDGRYVALVESSTQQPQEKVEEKKKFGFWRRRER